MRLHVKIIVVCFTVMKCIQAGLEVEDQKENCWRASVARCAAVQAQCLQNLNPNTGQESPSGLSSTSESDLGERTYSEMSFPASPRGKFPSHGSTTSLYESGSPLLRTVSSLTSLCDHDTTPPKPRKVHNTTPPGGAVASPKNTR